MLLLSLIIILAYLGLLLSFYFGFEKVPRFTLKDTPPKHKFSIIIPFRNESENLPELIDSLKALNYPTSHYEVIFINDESNDNSTSVIKETITSNKSRLDVALINNRRSTTSPKKDALELGILKSKYPYIITTDADVKVPKYWLDAFDEFIEESKADLVVGPVKLDALSSFSHRFQALEFLSLQAVTVGSFGINRPFMCNGANLCYKKSTFNELAAYKANHSLASGDDVFLLEAMIQSDEAQVAYLKSNLSVVTTKPENSWNAVIQQRHRWAAKSSSYQLFFGKLTGIVILLTNLIVLLLPFLIVFNLLNSRSALMLFLIKISIDFLVVFRASRFFDQTDILASFVAVNLFYPIISTYIVIKSFLMPYDWKGRRFKA